MSGVKDAAAGLREMDELSAGDSPIHALNPLGKLLVTMVYIGVTTSFHKYQLSGLMAMALYPALLFAVSGISVKTCLHKMRMVLPLVCAVGIFNPFFDREPLLYAGSLAISGGMVSMVTLIVKGVFCLTASFLLIATTPIDRICGALRKLHVPRMLVTLVLLTYRYVAVLAEEAAAMTMAYRLRAPGQKGIHFSAWGSFLGQLLLRSMDRAEEIYCSMQLRGFCGDFWYAETESMRAADVIFCLASLSCFFLFRRFDLAQGIGSLLM